jgi:hypothetical protein
MKTFRLYYSEYILDIDAIPDIWYETVKLPILVFHSFTILEQDYPYTKEDLQTLIGKYNFYDTEDEQTCGILAYILYKLCINHQKYIYIRYESDTENLSSTSSSISSSSSDYSDDDTHGDGMV